jgi:hypothetical protein
LKLESSLTNQPGDWTLIGYVQLDDYSAFQRDCGVNLEIVDVGIIVARYIKVTAVDFFGNGAALQFLTVV